MAKATDNSKRTTARGRQPFRKRLVVKPAETPRPDDELFKALSEFRDLERAACDAEEPLEEAEFAIRCGEKPDRKLDRLKRRVERARAMERAALAKFLSTRASTLAGVLLKLETAVRYEDYQECAADPADPQVAPKLLCGAIADLKIIELERRDHMEARS
jgi:hypothetical protein